MCEEEDCPSSRGTAAPSRKKEIPDRSRFASLGPCAGGAEKHGARTRPCVARRVGSCADITERGFQDNSALSLNFSFTSVTLPLSVSPCWRPSADAAGLEAARNSRLPAPGAARS